MRKKLNTVWATFEKPGQADCQDKNAKAGRHAFTTAQAFVRIWLNTDRLHTPMPMQCQCKDS